MEDLSNNLSTSPSDSNIDDLTLQLLLNSKNYHKVMKIKEPEKYSNGYQNVVFDNKNDILNITKDMVDGITDDYSVDIYEAFQNYVKMIFKHRELQEMQEQNEYNQEKYEQDELDKSNYDYVQKSFWSGERVIKRL